MNNQQLKNLVYKVLKSSNALATAAKTDPELQEASAAAWELYKKLSAISGRRLIAAGQKRDKGEVLWTVYAPIMCGKGEQRRSYGTRVTLRTPNLIGLAHLWHTDTESERKPMAWEPTMGGSDNPWGHDFSYTMKQS